MTIGTSGSDKRYCVKSAVRPHRRYREQHHLRARFAVAKTHGRGAAGGASPFRFGGVARGPGAGRECRSPPVRRRRQGRRASRSGGVVYFGATAAPRKWPVRGPLFRLPADDRVLASAVSDLYKHHGYGTDVLVDSGKGIILLSLNRSQRRRCVQEKRCRKSRQQYLRCPVHRSPPNPNYNYGPSRVPVALRRTPAPRSPTSFMNSRFTRG